MNTVRVVSGVSVLLSVAPVWAQERVDELEKRVVTLEKKVEAQPVSANPNADAATKKPGIVALSTDDVSIRFRPILQADGRFFLASGTNQFLARRVRPAIEATFYDRFDLRITPEFGGGTPSVVDAWANVKILPELQLRFGKMKSPFGLERLQNDSDLAFVERGLPSNLAPDRDIGVQLHGDIAKGTVTYALGIFDGAFDGQQIDGDNNDAKDLVGRLFVRPFAVTAIAPLRWLGLGVAASTGKHDFAVPAYKTAGQNAFFAYTNDPASPTFAAGRETRIAPQAFWYAGPVGAMFEWTRTRQELARTTTATVEAHIDATAWGAALSFFVTGEDASYTTVTPRHSFGALELDARVGDLRVQTKAFDTGLADPTKSARRATEIGAGVQWHFAPAIKLVVDYFRTTFDEGAKGGDRPTESVLIGRFQIAY
ncbi:MAG: OprO/OprP family phosphate-selective porin [Polyangiales bacterium]